MTTFTTTARTNGTGVDVYVGNVGVDGLDTVTVTVSASGYTTSKSATYYVPAVIGKTFSFDFPYIVVNTTYNVTIRVWSGTYPSRAASLQAHFNKHRNDVGVSATNIVSYLGKAVSTFNDTLKNTNNYNIVAQAAKPGFEAAHKYTHKL